MITLNCPHCSKSFTLPPEAVGKRFRCAGCRKVFTATDPTAAAEPLAPVAPITWSAIFGVLFLIVGLLVMGGYWIGYDTTVAGSSLLERVHNSGLMNNRLVGTVAGGVLAIVGAIMRTGPRE